MDTYALERKDALEFARFLDGLRTEKTFVECVGIQNNERNYTRNYKFPFKEYGEVKEACLLVNGNTFALMIIYEEYRISYSLQAPDMWEEVILESFGGDYKNCEYNHYNILTRTDISQIVSLLKGKFISGENNLYGILGSMAGNRKFFQNYVENIKG